MSVYIITAEGLDVAKIGFSLDPRARLTGHQISSPVALEIAAIIPGDMAAEKALHRRFSKDRVRGEWFTVSSALRELIAAFRYEPVKLSSGRASRYPVELIDHLGGTSAVARLIGARPSTVHSWRTSGNIPSWRIEQLRRCLGDDFPEQLSGAAA